MSRRPSNWDNPYADNKVKSVDPTNRVAHMDDGTCMYARDRKALRDAFEAGADAMLNDLRRMGTDPKWSFGLQQLYQNHKVVFIPNERESAVIKVKICIVCKRLVHLAEVECRCGGKEFKEILGKY